jgi:hypothetical protein
VWSFGLVRGVVPFVHSMVARSLDPARYLTLVRNGMLAVDPTSRVSFL